MRAPPELGSGCLVAWMIDFEGSEFCLLTEKVPDTPLRAKMNEPLAPAEGLYGEAVPPAIILLCSYHYVDSKIYLRAGRQGDCSDDVRYGILSAVDITKQLQKCVIPSGITKKLR